MEILEKPKKHDFWCDFRCFGFDSIVVPSGDVGGCSGGGKGVDSAARSCLEVKKSKYGGIFAFWVIFGVSVAHKSS